MKLNWQNNSRTPLLVLMALLTTVGSVMLAGCKADSPEQALRHQLQSMQNAASERDANEFMQGVADDFTGNDGFDRAALHNLLRMQMLANRNPGVSTGPLDVQIQGDKATVHFTVLLTGGNGRLLPDSAQGYAVTSGWRKRDGEWRLYYANWETRL